MHFFTRIKHWEYHPWWIANIPVYGFWLWFAARSRHLFFFSNVNPAIPLGGALGESKSDILRLLPKDVLPKSVLVEPESPFIKVVEQIAEVGMSFPIIAKPDVGERGFLVKKVSSEAELQVYLARWPVRFILQEFLTLPVEASVLYHVFPGHDGTFDITSVCLKEFLSVTGDGESTVRQLMAQNARSFFQIPRFERDVPDMLREIPGIGKTLLLEPIGNHARGTKFINSNHLISKQLCEVFERICRQIPNVRYARFDLKCSSVEALLQGDFKVMELNGVLGEPAHIYDPRHGMLRAYRDLWQHWKLLFRLHQAQLKMGHTPGSHSEAWHLVRGYYQYKKQLRDTKA